MPIAPVPGRAEIFPGLCAKTFIRLASIRYEIKLFRCQFGDVALAHAEAVDGVNAEFGGEIWKKSKEGLIS